MACCGVEAVAGSLGGHGDVGVVRRVADRHVRVAGGEEGNGFRDLGHGGRSGGGGGVTPALTEGRVGCRVLLIHEEGVLVGGEGGKMAEDADEVQGDEEGENGECTGKVSFL